MALPRHVQLEGARDAWQPGAGCVIIEIAPWLSVPNTLEQVLLDPPAGADDPLPDPYAPVGFDIQVSGDST